MSPHSHRPPLMGSSNLRSNSVCDPSALTYGFFPPLGLASNVAPRRHTSASPKNKSSNSSACSSQSSASTTIGIDPPILSTNNSFNSTTLALFRIVNFIRSTSGCVGVVSLPKTLANVLFPPIVNTAHSLGCANVTSIAFTSSIVRISNPHTAHSFAANGSVGTTTTFSTLPARSASDNILATSLACSPLDRPTTAFDDTISIARVASGTERSRVMYASSDSSPTSREDSAARTRDERGARARRLLTAPRETSAVIIVDIATRDIATTHTVFSRESH